jgi:Rad3-related DNA helicase
MYESCKSIDRYILVFFFFIFLGRCIRHINDYAVCILIDSRYNKPNIKNKLPGWVQNLSVAHNYGTIHKKLHEFFKSRENNQQTLYIKRNEIEKIKKKN